MTNTIDVDSVDAYVEKVVAAGGTVVKSGVTIGTAGADIAAGAWVHTHNCHSRFDERSATLDRHTGAPTDIRYV